MPLTHADGSEEGVVGPPIRGTMTGETELLTVRDGQVWPLPLRPEARPADGYGDPNGGRSPSSLSPLITPLVSPLV